MAVFTVGTDETLGTLTRLALARATVSNATTNDRVHIKRPRVDDAAGLLDRRPACLSRRHARPRTSAQ